MTSQNILIIGATSGMAEAVARKYASQGCGFMLVARSRPKLDVIAADLVARGALAVHTQVWDGADIAGLPNVVAAAWDALALIDVVLIAHGTLPDQQRAGDDLAYAVEHFRINAESAIACMLAVAPRLEAQGAGTLAVIGSVAGDRGRQSNFLYGAAKSAVAACASGLRARLFKRGVNVLLVKPGFVSTPMTAALNLPAKLTATVDHVAADIIRGIGRGAGVIYTPRFWQLIMWIIRQIPEAIFKRLSL